MTEERVCEYADGAIENFQFEKQKEKKIDKKTQNFSHLWDDIKKVRCLCTGVAERKEIRWAQKKYLEK